VELATSWLQSLWDQPIPDPFPLLISDLVAINMETMFFTWPLVQVGFEKFKIEFGSYILLLSVSFFLVACFKFWHVHLQVETWTPWVPHDSIGKVPLTEAASQEPSWIDGSHPKCFKHKFQYCVKGRFTW
jgi:hypothetical protein